MDLGIKEAAVLSDRKAELPEIGIHEGIVPNPKNYRRAERKLAKEQRKLSRCKMGSKRREKQKKKVQKVHAKIFNQRKDFLEKLTTFLVSNYENVCIEDLNVSGMMKNHHLAKSIADADFCEFRRMLEYKASLHGCTIHYANRFYPSSKRCSNCGSIKKDLTLKDRTYVCKECGLIIDRDYNASLNLLHRAGF